MEGHLVMSEKERRRPATADPGNVEFEGIVKERMTLCQASQRLRLSYPATAGRSYKRYREEGDRGLVHRSRGEESTLPSKIRRGEREAATPHTSAEMDYHLPARSQPYEQFFLTDRTHVW